MMIKCKTLVTGLLFTAASGIFLFSCQQKETSKRVSVTGFGALPDDGQNYAGALRKAMEYSKRIPAPFCNLPRVFMISATKKPLN